MSETRTQTGEFPMIPDGATLYEILGVDRDASLEDLRVAYRRLALLFHPDRHPEEDRERASDVFGRIAAAYATLSDPTERQRYDFALDHGEEFDGGNVTASGSALADILAGINAYEHIFSADKLSAMSSTLANIVTPEFMTELHEQIVGVWKLPGPPAGAEHPGTFTAGAVVLTTLRVLLPYTYSWEETQGDTKYRYRGASMPAFVLPLIRGITLISHGRARKSLWIEIQGMQGTLRFRSGDDHFGKLLLIARLWGIEVESRHEEAARAEWRWALVRPWLWAAGFMAASFALASLLGVFAGGFVDNPEWLAKTMSRYGLWQWFSVACALESARRTWRCTMLYSCTRLVPAELLAPSSQAGASPDPKNLNLATT